ncbi:hypothetical protein AcV5_002551 [Taiwanofungus camphoratus]|nr:hypothetical protein AcV5_002551 [Antrodia cinnamomea]
MDLLPNAALESLTLSDDTPSEVKHICIIGAGAAGLAALKVITDTIQYKEGLWKPIAFEEREKVGGVWLPAPPTGNPPVTPLYDSLTTNLPHPVMAYPSLSFPPSTPLFPPASTVETYLENYASHFKLTPFIRLKTIVDAVDWDAASSKWSVRVTGDEIHTFDYLIVANGHYRLPRFPTTPGLADWIKRGKATHSAWYRHPYDLGKTVLVVGGGPSGLDISAEMRTVARTVIHSITGGSPEDVDGGSLKRRGRVAEFLDVDEGRVRFEDGTVDTGIDHCILATGYQYNYSFFPPSLLHLSFPPPAPPLPPDLYNSTYHLFPLARHLFPLTTAFPPSRAAFLGLLMKVVPLPLIEAQMHAVVKVFAEPETLDTTQEAVAIVSRYEQLRARVGDSDTAIAKAWVRFVDHEQFDYRDELHALAGGPFAGDEWKVPSWAKECYYRAAVMRAEWQALEKTGEAAEWVCNVGKGGEQEWVDLMYRVLHRADERQETTGEKTKL